MPHPRIKVKPAAGLIVAKPGGGRLAQEGEEVQLTTYWSRRLAAGDVVRVTKPAKPTEPKAKAKS